MAFPEQIGVLDVPVSHGLNQYLVVKRFLANLLIVPPELTLERYLKIFGTLEMVTSCAVS